MYQRILSPLIALLILMSGHHLFAQTDSSDASISTDSQGWIDRNKNGEKDPYEDPELAVEDRIADLIGQMTIEEKTAQMGTIYGYKRVLKDARPTEKWKKEVWKDGIGNIDEHCNGVKGELEYVGHKEHAELLNVLATPISTLPSSMSCVTRAGDGRSSATANLPTSWANLANNSASAFSRKAWLLL